jgi:hypothetical protein
MIWVDPIMQNVTTAPYGRRVADWHVLVSGAMSKSDL